MDLSYPVSEFSDLNIRLTYGCPWNKCYFCDLYLNSRYTIRSIKDIEANIREAADHYEGKNFLSCFLHDGDAFSISTEKWLEILGLIKRYLPYIKTIKSYARADSLLRKPLHELKLIREAGLNHLYFGMESGSDIILKKINKGNTTREIIDSALLAKEAGIVISEFYLNGAGGHDLVNEHATKSAEILNIINPDYIHVHTLAVKQNTELYRLMETGEFILPSEKDMMIEQKILLENLEDVSSFYLNEHMINLMIEANGKLPNDKKRILNLINSYLELNGTDRQKFELGRRLGKYSLLRDLKNEKKTKALFSDINDIDPNKLNHESEYNKLCNSYRARLI